MNSHTLYSCKIELYDLPNDLMPPLLLETIGAIVGDPDGTDNVTVGRVTEVVAVVVVVATAPGI